MKHFSGACDAKEYLASRIVAEAQLEGVTLSESERAMLHFSETDSMPPTSRETIDTFYREYNQEEYEKKIVRLIRNARKRERSGDQHDYDDWSEAIRTLGNQDHYLLLLIGKAGGSERPPGDLLKLVGTALALIVAGFPVVYLAHRAGIPMKGEAGAFFVWAATICAAGVYLLLRLILGRRRVDEFLNRFADFLARLIQKAGLDLRP